MDPFILVLRIQIWGHTDQVPVYIEDHSKGTWGVREDHTRRTVGTAGKERDRFDNIRFPFVKIVVSKFMNKLLSNF